MLWTLQKNWHVSAKSAYMHQFQSIKLPVPWQRYCGQSLYELSNLQNRHLGCTGFFDVTITSVLTEPNCAKVLTSFMRWGCTGDHIVSLRDSWIWSFVLVFPIKFVSNKSCHIVHLHNMSLSKFLNSIWVKVFTICHCPNFSFIYRKMGYRILGKLDWKNWLGKVG